ncbi:alpha-L-rhamnosidase C-terminal domain-containing protein [Bacillus sinesaloumensis]|uniref:alpha-L-rhamnosidase-related protein n=1 Tax=Litchfieldia sinesaloumensis TaxID=1926280 RepID=UPI0009883956|nr:alpha-L-rhamnosidase C-terminal domain-containing protein [Bacillus sinesaloumensis]
MGKVSNVLKSQIKGRSEKDNRVREYIQPNRILWKTDGEHAKVENESGLLEKSSGQITLNTGNACVLRNNGGNAGLLLDFGVELQGGIEILVWGCGPSNKAKLRVRFGESAMEAMSELGENNATNDHAIRDQIIDVSFLGMIEVGNTGFRFARVDLLEEDSFVEIKSIRAVFQYKDIEYKGSFASNDPLLNQIWETGAYTVHLNMQNYLWDGIKRDRLVWVGDMHPETSTIQAVFGYDDSVPRSLDIIRDDTEIPNWMNSFPSYSMWWIIIQHDWYMQNGDLSYLKEQEDYLVKLLDLLSEYIEKDGRSMTPNQFLDWPSSENPRAVEAGVHSLLTIAMEKGAKLVDILKGKEVSGKYIGFVNTLKQYIPDHANNKQAAALMVLAGLENANSINNDVLAVDGAHRISTFLGYYVLKSRALAGDIKGCLESIREYWGGMLALGATTFWEDFDLNWLENAARIDELVPEDKVNVHATYGNYCYKGYRHSLCHGWASGPTAWMAEYILGIKVLEPGCKAVEIKPSLGDLEWVEGTYPTPLGTIYVRHEKQTDGTIKSDIQAPDGVKIIH